VSLENWDFEHQRLETAASVAEIRAESGLAKDARVDLDLEFAPASDAADAPAALKALGMFGYAADVEDGRIQVTVPDVAFDAAEIWRHEERTSRIALARGFEPDGWGFQEP
jgi:hypothetical protein